MRRSLGESGGGPGREAASAPLPDFLCALVEGLESAEAYELDLRLRRVVALEQRLEAELGPLLARVASRRLYRLRGFSGLERYAAERLGISARKAWALLRIERAGRRCPALLAAYREGRLSWVQAQALVAIVRRTPEHAEAWITCARRVCVRRLRDDVDRALLLADTNPETFARSGGVPDLDAELACETDEEAALLQIRANIRDTGATHRPPQQETFRAFFSARRDVARLFRATVATVRRRIGPRATLSDALDAMLEHCFETWNARDPRRKREYRIFERDGWRCAVPGCTSYRNLHAHHKQYRSRGGDDADENLITLCAWHHQKAVHQDRVLRILGRERTRFELGVRRDGPPLAVYASGDLLAC